MHTRRYRYVFDLARAKDDSPLGSHPVQLDLAPVGEWGRFLALQTWLDPKRAAEAEISIQPEWHPKAGAPYVEGLRVAARARGVPTVSAVVPRGYFKRQVLPLSDRLVDSKKLQPGEQFTYVILAYPETEEPSRTAAAGIEVEEVPVPIDLKTGALPEMIAKSTAHGDVEAESIPVFVSSQVIAEAISLTEQAKELEVGSILIGHLRKDAGARSIFLEVTAQIPARHTLSETTSLSFTPETWAAAQAAIALRRSDEQMVGWFHSHPARYWCAKDCSPERRQQCSLGKSFFSSADCDLQRTCFLQPYCVGLLVTHGFTGMKLAMFSWKDATIVQRGFHIINSNGAAQLLPEAEAAPCIGDTPHETSCHSEPAHH